MDNNKIVTCESCGGLFNCIHEKNFIEGNAEIRYGSYGPKDFNIVKTKCPYCTNEDTYDFEI